MAEEGLFDRVRSACFPATWSRGVELTRLDAVVGERADGDEIVFRVTTRGGMICPQVTLFSDDEDWDCECSSREDVCEHVAAAVIASLKVLKREPERRKQLWENTEYMKRELQNLGFDTGNSDSPVIPPVIGDEIATFTMATRLQEEGVFANAIVPPAVPQSEAMIRTSYMATHTREHLDMALTALAKVGRELDVI